MNQILTVAPHIQKLRDFYAMKPGAPLYQCEFGFFTEDLWRAQGYMDDRTNKEILFGFDVPAAHDVWGLGWCEGQFYPLFEEKVLEDRGDYELVQDVCGRGVLCFKGKRDGFMPTYESHPVTDMASWEENILPRMQYENPMRQRGDDSRIQEALIAVSRGMHIVQRVVGAYMYLRSLMGPEDLLYKFYDDPELIHACMRGWLSLADKVTANYQQHFAFDEIFFGEDICYKNGPLISPDMIKEFLFPYYQQLIANVKARQPGHDLIVQLDTDGYAPAVLELYRDGIGMNFMSPFEVASGCDVVAIGEKYPDLRMMGGIDKRILAAGKDEIEKELQRIIPVMRARGGYIPCCDHGVPEEVSFENYMYYRRRMMELGN